MSDQFSPNRRQMLQAGLASLLAPAARAATAPPNVIFFLTDDHGSWAANCYGCSDMHTPNLDRLAAEGARFTRAYACTPVCSASRMTYLTGKLPSHHGVQDWLMGDDSVGPKARPFLKGQTAFSDVLASNGYTVGLTGKWHMGGDEHAQAGFSYWATVPGAGGTYKDPVFVKNGQQVPTKGYKTNYVGDYALEFIEQNHQKPFCLYCPFYAPHVPYDYQPEDFRRYYNNSSFPCFPNEPIHPWHTRTIMGNNRFPMLDDFNNRESKLSYSALVTGMDYNIGRILRRLEELGIRENTVIVFSADQGHNCGHHGIWGKGNATVPINMYDTSLHVPLIWNHPGRIPARQTPTPMVSSYDFFPTLLDYLGIQAAPEPHRVGRSYARFLRGESPAWHNELYFEYQYVRGIRTENMKYVERTEEWPSELFDLETDPGERQNVIDDKRHAAQLTALRARLTDFFQKTGAPPIDQWRTTTTQNLCLYGR
jgi:choline-sulfatase